MLLWLIFGSSCTLRFSIKSTFLRKCALLGKFALLFYIYKINLLWFVLQTTIEGWNDCVPIVMLTLCIFLTLINVHMLVYKLTAQWNVQRGVLPTQHIANARHFLLRDFSVLLSVKVWARPSSIYCVNLLKTQAPRAVFGEIFLSMHIFLLLNCPRSRLKI